MHHAFRNNESLSWRKFDRAVGQVNQQLSLDHVETFVVIVVLASDTRLAPRPGEPPIRPLGIESGCTTFRPRQRRAPARRSLRLAGNECSAAFRMDSLSSRS